MQEHEKKKCRRERSDKHQKKQIRIIGKPEMNSRKEKVLTDLVKSSYNWDSINSKLVL